MPLSLNLALAVCIAVAYRGLGGRRLEGYGRLGRALCGVALGGAAAALAVIAAHANGASMERLAAVAGLHGAMRAWALVLPAHGAGLLVLAVMLHDRVIGLPASLLLLLAMLPLAGASSWAVIVMLLPAWLAGYGDRWLPVPWHRFLGRYGLAALFPALPVFWLAIGFAGPAGWAILPALLVGLLHVPACLGLQQVLKLQDDEESRPHRQQPPATQGETGARRMAELISTVPGTAKAKLNPAILERTIADLPEGIAIFDVQDRLIASNSVYRNLHAEFEAELKPGASYDDLLRFDVMRRGVTVGDGAKQIKTIGDDAGADAAQQDPEAVIAELRQRHRQLPWRQEMRRPNGQWLRVIESRSGDGGTLRIVSDITAVKTRELRLTELAERNALLATAISSVTSGVIICDAMREDIPITFVNAAFCRITGYSADEVLGRNCRFLQGRDSDPATLERLRRAIEQRRPVQVTLKNYRKDGKLFWNDLHISPVVDDDGGVRQFIGIIHEATARMRTEESLREAKNQAELANRSKTEFLANISHELRTPLNAIIGFSEVMRLRLFGKLGAEQYEGYVRDIHDSGQHLLSLINDLLDLSKIEAGRYTLAPERCPAGNLLDTCLRLVRDRATIGGLKLSSAVAPGTPDLFVDRRAALQIITNLLSNAVKFTPANGSVHLKVEPADGARTVASTGASHVATPFVAITVRDTGIGIAKADIPKVLAAFGQVDNSLTRKHDGTGLGLPIVKALTEHHGGTLAIDSEPGKGTTVRVTLPAAAMPAPAKEAVQETLI
jgi:PAS domain S-box-containing protein